MTYMIVELVTKKQSDITLVQVVKIIKPLSFGTDEE
jgi:hypothetical protein